MRKVLSKVLAVGLAAGVVLTQGSLASAALTNDDDAHQIVNENGDDVNQGEIDDATQNVGLSFEGHVNKNIIKAVVPTISNPDMYKAILDPERLIASTLVEVDGEYKYFKGGEGREKDGKPVSFEEGTMYFKNVTKPEEGGDDVISFSPRSDSLTITNKGTVPLDIALNVSLTGQEGLEIVDSDEFKGNVASMYMAVEDDKGVTPVTAVTDGDNTTYKASVKTFVQGADEGLYHVNGKDGDGYKFEENDNAEGFSTYSFHLTGACNPNGIYSDTKDDGSSAIDPGKINVVWTLNEAYKEKNAPVSAEYNGDEKSVRLFGSKDGATIVGEVSADAEKPAYKFVTDSVKVAGPGMDYSKAASVSDAELVKLDGDNADSQVVKVQREKIADALKNSSDATAKECVNSAGDDVIGGSYRIFYKVGNIEFVGIVELPEAEN